MPRVKESFAPKAKIIHIDIDAAEFDKNIISDAHILGDLGKTLEKLSTMLPPGENPEWLGEIAEFKGGFRARSPMLRTRFCTL